MFVSWFSTFRLIATVLANLMFIKYFIFLVIAPFYVLQEALRRRKIQRRGVYTKYQVSVIVPAWNEEVGILKTVKSILDNTYSHVEVVIVNDGSTDNTSEIVTNFIKSIDGLPEDHPWRQKKITFVDKEKNAGKGAAINSGILQSFGDIILTVDGDSFLRNDAISNLVVYYQDPSISGAVGNVIVANTDTVIGITQRLEYIFGFYFKRAHAVMGSEYIFGGACASFRREVFDKIGYFDEKNKTEDIEMTMRFRYNGYQCTYAEDVVCFTEGASDILGLLAQRRRWSKGRLDTFIKYRSMFFSKDKRHNKALAYFVLPYALLSEFQLFFEPLSIALLLTYSFVALDFLSLALGILFIGIQYLINGIFSGGSIRWRLLLLYPLSWTLFYFLIWVEFVAHLSSLGMLLRGEEIEWQSWERKGI